MKTKFDYISQELIAKMGGLSMLLQFKKKWREGRGDSGGDGDDDDDDGDDGDNSDNDDEEAIIHLHFGLIECVNLMISETSSLRSCIPMVYNASYLLQEMIQHIVQLLHSKNAMIGYKAIELTKHLLCWIPESTFKKTHHYDADAVTILLSELLEYMTKQCEEPKMRENVFFQIFNPLLDRCEANYRFSLVERLLLETRYSTVVASLLYCMKEQFHREWKEKREERPTGVSHPLVFCEQVVRVLEMVLSSEEKMKDDVVANSLVNVMRFVLLVDTPEENCSGIWDVETRDRIEAQLLKMSASFKSRIEHHQSIARDPKLLQQQLKTIEKFNSTEDSMSINDCRISNESAALNLLVIDSLVQHTLELIKKQQHN